MVSKEDGVFVLWPLYFDANTSRAQGRRVPSKLAVKNPTVDEIATAARSLRLEVRVENEAAHPSRWFLPSGRVLVRRKATKTRVIRAVAKRIKRIRARS